MQTYSKFFIRTLKEAPRDAETPSHQLMVRAGMIRKVASGIYTILPMGLRVFAKLENIIREEMNKVGGIECLMPHVVPAELWKTSGRWDVYGQELLRFTDRADRDFCFGPTHEEVITELVSAYTNSYKQLPVMLYQIQSKFRDEVRPRFGLMRGREFVMKDAYSFHDSQDSLDDYYQACREAYAAIFNRCGLTFTEAKAASGAIGGDVSAEFLVIADTGEDEVLVCPEANYAANVEAAACLPSKVVHSMDDIPNYELVQTPNVKTIQDVATFLSVPTNQTLKSLLVFNSDAKPVLVCVSGDRAVNEVKLAALLGGDYKMATDAEVQKICGCAPGFIGPVGDAIQDIQVLLDGSLKEQPTYVCGANQLDAHFTSVVIARDIPTGEWVDVCNARAGDPCPTDPNYVLQSQRGIEVGHVFKLGQKYSKAMNAQYTTASGALAHFEMGCYGIGVGRTIAAAIEQSHDENGIIWPASLAPFKVVILNLLAKDTVLDATVEAIYKYLTDIGVDVIVDDRHESPGIKFKDADLIGFPFQIVLGKKTLESEQLELRLRGGDVHMISLDALPDILTFIK